MQDFAEFIGIFEYYLAYLRQLNIPSLVLRLLLAMFVGGLIGIERERRGRAAGFRTYMLVALGSATTIILSQYYGVMFSGPWAAIAEEMGITTDLSRFGAQVINGVGFLAAGTVIVTGRQEVKGLTTAAGLWASACVGLAVGAGFYEGVLVSFILIFVCIRLLTKLESFVVSKTPKMHIYMEMDNIESLGNILSFMKNEKIKLYDVEIDKAERAGLVYVTALMSVNLPKRMEHTAVVASLSTLRGAMSVEEV